MKFGDRYGCLVNVKDTSMVVDVGRTLWLLVRLAGYPNYLLRSKE